MYSAQSYLQSTVSLVEFCRTVAGSPGLKPLQVIREPSSADSGASVSVERESSPSTSTWWRSPHIYSLLTSSSTSMTLPPPLVEESTHTLITDSSTFHIYDSSTWWKSPHIYLLPNPPLSTSMTLLPPSGGRVHTFILTMSLPSPTSGRVDTIINHATRASTC